MVSLPINNMDIAKRQKNSAHFEEVEVDMRRGGRKLKRNYLKWEMEEGAQIEKKKDIQWELVETVGWRVG